MIEVLGEMWKVISVIAVFLVFTAGVLGVISKWGQYHPTYWRIER